MAENQDYLGNFVLISNLRDLYEPKQPKRLGQVKLIEDRVLDDFRKNVYDLNSETTPDFFTKVAEVNHKKFGIPESYTFNILFRFFVLGGEYHLKEKVLDSILLNQKVENSESFIYDDVVNWVNNEADKILKAYEKSSEKYTKQYIV